MTTPDRPGRPGLTRDRLAAARESLRASTSAAPAGTRPPTLPTAAEVATLSTDEILATLERFGVRPAFGAFQDAMMREARDLGNAPGGALSEAAEERIRESIERSFRSSAAQATKRLVTDYRLAAQFAAGAQADWSAVNIAVGDESTCDDCDDLHGEERTLGEWLASDRPGSASRQCRARCRCELVPINPGGDASREDLGQPEE